MADLGDIRTVNPNAGTTPVDTRTLERGVNQALGVVANVHQNNVVDEAADLVGSTIDDAVAGSANPPDAVADPSLDPAVDDLRRNVLDLQQDVINGNRAEAARAQIEIDTALAPLLKSHPRLAQQIRSEIAGQIASSPELASLGLQDAANKTAATQARQQLLDMRNKATKRWSEGGLGMSFNSDFTDPTVLTEFLEKDAARSMVEATKMRSAVLVAGGSATVEQLLTATNDMLIGEKSGFAPTLAEQQQLSKEYYDELKKPPEEQSAAVIDGFAANREQFIFENEQQKLAIIEGFDIVWDTVIKRSQPEYGAALAMRDDRIKMLDSWIGGLREVQPSRYYETQEAALKSEAWGLRHTVPGYNQFLQWDALDPNGLIWQMIKESPSGANVPVQNLTSTAGAALAKGFWNYSTPEDEVSGLFLNSGRGKITPTMTPSEIVNVLANEQRQGPYPMDARTDSETDEIQVGMTRQAAYKVRYNQMLNIPKFAEPKQAADLMLASTNVFVMYQNVGNPSRDQTLESAKFLADDGILHGIRTVGDSEFQNVRFTFASQAKDFLGNNNRPYAQARIANQEAWRAPMLGRELRDFVSVQFFDDENDRLSIDINEEAVTEAAFNDSRTPTVSAIRQDTLSEWAAKNEPLIDNRMRTIRTAAQQVVDFANTDIRATAHIQFADSRQVSGANEPSYRLMADRTGWLDILGGQ